MSGRLRLLLYRLDAVDNRLHLHDHPRAAAERAVVHFVVIVLRPLSDVVQFMDGETLIYGIIDRLVISGDTAFVVDYKTHRSASSDTVATLAEDYREQMRLYTLGVAKLWPQLQVRPYQLFTRCQKLVAMDEPASA